MILTRFVRSMPALVGCLLLAGMGASGQEATTPEFKAPELKRPSQKLPAIFSKATPESVDDLKAIQDHVARLVEKITPSVVSVRIGANFGSGVIVSKDGYVLTAGHVSGKPGRDVVVYLHNGKTVKGTTLGGNHGIDSGMIKITTEGDWPFVDMGDSRELKTGHWCLVCAHPSGFKVGRSPPVRLGRLLKASDTTLTTDCILVGGDSGGPLFDMHGRVIGINSRIGQSVTANLHVPVNPYRDHWEKIAKSEVWGGKLGAPAAKNGPYLGIHTDTKGDRCVVLEVTAGSPADKAGLKANDVILKFADKEVTSATMLTKLVQARKAGDQIVLEVVRGDETLALKVEIGKRP